MKDKNITIISSIVVAIIIMLMLFFFVPKGNPNPEPKEKPPIKIKEETIEEEGITKLILNLNDTKHIFTIVKGLDNKSTVTFDKINLLSFIESEYDYKVYQKIKGEDAKDYFAFALANYENYVYKQYLYIFSSDGKLIYEVNDETFGIAVTDYENQIEISLDSLYGNTGMVKIDNNQITYLTFNSYTPGEMYSLYDENVCHINGNTVNVTKVEPIKVLVTAAGA